MKKMLLNSSGMMLAGMCITGIALGANAILYLLDVYVKGQTFYVIVLAIIFLLNVLGYVNGKEVRSERVGGTTK